MRTRLALALLLVSTSAAAAAPPKPVPAPSPFELTLEVVPAQPRPGQSVYWLGKLRNASARTLYVPTRTAEWLSFYAVHFKPAEGRNAGHGNLFATQQPPLAWRPLAPGAVLEKGGALGDDLPECRHGCPVGDVQMTLEMAIPPNLGDEAPDADHIVPRGLGARAGISIRVPTYPLLERASPDAVALSVLGVRAGQGGLRVRLRLENRTDAPLWLPRPALWRATCVVTETAPGGWGVPGTRFGQDVAPLSLKQALLVQPGRALTGEVLCEGWGMPRRGTVAVTLAAPQWAEARRPMRVPFVWTGMVESSGFSVGRGL